MRERRAEHVAERQAPAEDRRDDVQCVSVS